MNLDDKILNKIKEEKITPTPFWYFLVKDYSLWLLVLLSIILASLSIAPIIFIFQNLDLAYAKHITQNIFTFILINLPYFWIILCAVTTYLATLAWEKTKHGYKFNGERVFTISFIVSLILGILLNLWNLGRMIDNRMHDASMGQYKSFEERRRENWFKPEDGRLIGTVENISTSSFTLSNEQNNFSKEIFFDENIPGKENISDGNDVRVVGYVPEKENNRFLACAIFPDNLPPEKRGLRKGMHEQMQEKIKKLQGRPEIHEECKKIFEKGRANFVK